MNQSEENIIAVYKSIGLTPLQAIEKIKILRPKYYGQKISYAGRLDPMAEGVLLLLVGEENKRRKEYEVLRKVYEAEIVLGISTDTYDALGVIQDTHFGHVEIRNVEAALEKMIGEQNQFYPPFSSKPVNGRALYWWARENRLSEITLPSKKIVIDEIKIISEKRVVIKDVVERIIGKISKIQGNFRQDEIVKTWVGLKDKHPDESVMNVGVRVKCSSGTYIRGIADSLGKILGTGAFTNSIKRIQVGTYTEKDCIKFSEK